MDVLLSYGLGPMVWLTHGLACVTHLDLSIAHLILVWWLGPHRLSSKGDTGAWPMIIAL